MCLKYFFFHVDIIVLQNIGIFHISLQKVFEAWKDVDTRKPNLVFYQLCHLSLVIPVLSLVIPGLSLAIPGLSLLVPSHF